MSFVYFVSFTTPFRAAPMPGGLVFFFAPNSGKGSDFGPSLTMIGANSQRLLQNLCIV